MIAVANKPIVSRISASLHALPAIRSGCSPPTFACRPHSTHLGTLPQLGYNKLNSTSAPAACFVDRDHVQQIIQCTPSVFRRMLPPPAGKSWSGVGGLHSANDYRSAVHSQAFKVLADRGFKRPGLWDTEMFDPVAPTSRPEFLLAHKLADVAAAETLVSPSWP